MSKKDPSVKSEIVDIKSHLVGWFYHNKPPLLLGSQIEVGTVVGLINQLGIDNDVVSKVNGRIVGIAVRLIKDEQGIEYGQLLFRVELT